MLQAYITDRVIDWFASGGLIFWIIFSLFFSILVEKSKAYFEGKLNLQVRPANSL